MKDRRKGERKEEIRWKGVKEGAKEGRKERKKRGRKDRKMEGWEKGRNKMETYQGRGEGTHKEV